MRATKTTTDVTMRGYVHVAQTDDASKVTCAKCLAAVAKKAAK
jgi:hypothetical protein